MPKVKSHKTLVEEALRRPGVRKEYDALEEEFELLKEMIKARRRAGKTQEDVAKEMKTTTSVVGRLETAGGRKHHSPSINTLQRYAHAVGCELSIKFVMRSKKKLREE